MKKIFLFLAIILLIQEGWSQTITTGETIESYIENVLIGGGVEVSNITINTTEPNVIGEFSGFGSTNLGLDHGLVVACGTVVDVNSPASSFASETVGSGSDPDLASISSATINDAVVIEFDFVPQSDHIEFRYIFGSEEFPEYVGSYNDAFGFFITSPAGDDYNYAGENIALLPITGLPVTINNVFGTSSYFDNQGGNGQDIIYDGFTTVLTAEADVTPCMSYHIKLAIGDAGDSSYDSGFFLDAFSFSTNAPTIDLDFSDVVDPINNSVIEGCTSVDIIFEVEEPFTTATTIDFLSVTGTAIQGIDYSNIGPGVTFQAGDTLAVVTINPILDTDYEELTETIQIIVETTFCEHDTLNFTILNSIPVVADFITEQSLCEGETTNIVFTGEAHAGDSVVWNFDGGTIISGNPDGTGLGPFEVGWATFGIKNVSVVLISENGCTTDNHSVPVTIKQTPSCEFAIAGPICSGGQTTLTYLNDLNAFPIPCPSMNNFTYDPLDIEFIPTSDPCVWTITAENLTDAPINYPISFQVTVDGCTSPICEDFLTVYPPGQEDCCADPVAYAGEDVSLCSLDHIMGATLGGGGNHGQWIYVTGPTVTFIPNSAQGSATEPGNPQAHIAVDGPGDLIMIWREWSGECFDEDEVEITFVEQPDLTFGEEEYIVCGLTANLEVFSSVNPGTSLQWLNPNSPTTSIVGETQYNPAVSATTFGTYNFACVGTVSDQCKDTAEIMVTFVEVPVADAGEDQESCGLQDTLNAVSTYGGYWELHQYNGSGVNCSQIFTNHITGEPDIYDPNAVVTVSCEGEWIFKWHEINGQCETTDNVSYTFSPSSINITALEDSPNCYRYTQVHVDTTGFSDDTWYWQVDTNWQYHNIVNVDFDPYDPAALVYRAFPESAFGDSGYVEIPMNVTLIKDGCLSTTSSSVTFYQRPSPKLGMDTMVCDNEIHFNVTPTIPLSVSSQQWYGTGFGGTYTASPDNAYETTISAPLGDSLYIVFSEENILGNDDPTCLVRDSILVEFLKRPIPDAGDAEANICGNCIQLDAHLDNSVNSIGRWEINNQGQFGYFCGDNNDAAVADSNAWFYHSTDPIYGKDVVYVVWKEFNAKSEQCAAVDSVPITFWYEGTAEITLNNNASLEDSTCGREYYNISGNTNMPSNPNSNGFWRTVGNPVEWFKDGEAGAYDEPLLDYIRVNSIGEQASVTKEIYWVIRNGDIYGDDVPAVCVDTSETVIIRFDNEVEANILSGEEYPELTPNCGDTICLTALFEKEWTHFQWSPNDYTFYNNDFATSRADTLSVSCLIAPSNIYPNADTAVGGDTHETIILKAFNGMCVVYDNINVIFAPIPTGGFTKQMPHCFGEEATLIIERSQDTDLDKYIETVNWIWEEDDEPTQIIPANESQDTISVLWGNSADNNDFKHAVSVETINVWGCSYRINPPDTVVEPHPAYVQFTDDEYPTCGECDGELIFQNYSNEYSSPVEYAIEWANNKDFNNSANDIIEADSIIALNELCAGEYYVLVSYQSSIGGNCNDTLYFDLHADESSIATSNFEFLTDTADLQAPFVLDNMSLSNTSLNANKYTWQIFNGTEEDLSMLVYEGNQEIPDYVFSNMGEYLIKLQSFNDKAPNCPANPVDMNIFVHYESVIEVPNIFTPNDDGINDEFTIKTRELNAYQCIIYNRWGQKVFESADENESWDGTMKNNGNSKVTPGSYFYVITGKGKKGQDFEFKGTVQVVTDKK